MRISFDELNEAFEIMGKGMGGIFAVIIILTLIVILLPYLSKLVDFIQMKIATWKNNR